MIPTISDTEIREDYMYEDDNEIRIIHGLDKAMIYAHPSTRKDIGIKIKDKKATADNSDFKTASPKLKHS